MQGGWHDAGDFCLYSASLNHALFWLLLSYADFSPTDDDLHLPESGNGLPDVLDEARWGLLWLLSVQDASGGFRNTTCQDGYGPYGTNTPNSVPPYTAGEVGTLATARAVGNLAFAAAVFRPLDAAFASRCLAAARRGVDYLDAHAGEATDGPSCSSFRADGNVQVAQRARSFAAAGMLLATGEARFVRTFEETAAAPSYDVPFLHLSGPAALLYLRAPAGTAGRKQALWAALRANADVALAEGARHPFGWAGRYHWGSLGAGFLRAALHSVPLCLQSPVAASAHCEQALASLHYAFGRNLKQFCYVTGLPGTSHGMQWGFHQWLAALRASAAGLSRHAWPVAPTNAPKRRTSPRRRDGQSRRGVTLETPPFRGTAARPWTAATRTMTAGARMKSPSNGRQRRCTFCTSPAGTQRIRLRPRLSRRGEGGH